MSNILRGSLTSDTSSKGALGFKGERGYSNYELYVKNGGTMTEQEWLDHFGVDLTDYIKTSEVLDLVYPVGSLYISVNSTNPSTLFGGTWEQISGRYLLGAGVPSQNTNTNMGSLTQEQLTWNFTAGETLGEYTHPLSIEEMPSHTHSYNSRATTFASTGTNSPSQVSGDRAWENLSIGYTGGSQAHNTMSACLVVYMWKRTQ